MALTPGTVTAPRGYPTASLAVQAELAQAFYSAQALLAAMSVADVLAVWNQLNLRDVRSSWPAIRTALEAVITNRASQAAAGAQGYYTQARQAAGVTGAPPAVTVPPPSPRLMQATLDSTGPWSLLGRVKKAQPLDQAMANTSVVMSGAASRLVSNGARQTVLASVQADPQAVAWMRVTAANPCSWCSMLSSRGPVYKSQQSAGFLAHNHCRCTAQAVFSKEDAEALRDNDLYGQWKEVTRGYHKHEAVLAWRRYWDKQMNRDGIRVLPAA